MIISDLSKKTPRRPRHHHHHSISSELIVAILTASYIAGSFAYAASGKGKPAYVATPSKQYHDKDHVKKAKRVKVRVEMRIPDPTWEPSKVENCNPDQACDVSAPWVYQPQEK